MNVELPLVGAGYEDETSIISAESTINMFPEVVGTETPRTRVILRTHAGLTRFSHAVSGATRGIVEMGNVLYVVAGQTLYRIDSSGVVTSLGTILGSDRVMFSENFIPATRRQLIIMTGGRGYVYDTVTGVQEITDPDFTAVANFDTVTTVDSYTIVATADGFAYSAVTDATDWNALDFKTAESNPDGMVAVFSAYGDLWCFGKETIEVFRNTGNLDDPFQRVQTIDYGIGARFSIQNVDNGVIWIDDDGLIQKANGFNPVIISDHAVEQYLASVDFTDAYSFTYTDRGHEFYGFTVPNGKTFLYDMSSRRWHRRKSEGVEFWRVIGAAKAYGMTLFGDYADPTVWKLDTSAVSEVNLSATPPIDDRLIRERVTGYLHAATDPLTINRITLIADTGNAIVSGDADETDPQIEMRWSDNGGKNWSTWQARSLGRVGEYGQRINWTRLGQIKPGRSRVFHFRTTDAVRADLLTVSVNVDKNDQT